jgi:predicted metal-binding membrane protein
MRVGVDYGLSCLGCCAALMLVMFAVGMSSPLVMVGLGGVAALHKHAPWGPQLATATGGVLLADGALVGALHLAGVH